MKVRVYTPRARGKGPERPEILVVVRNERDSKSWTYLASDTRTKLRELVRVGSCRHGIEQVLNMAKGDVGLDEYELRSWVGWHHHMTLSIISLWFLVCEHRRLKKILLQSLSLRSVARSPSEQCVLPATVRELRDGGGLPFFRREASAPLSEGDYATLKMAVDTLAFLTEELATKGATVERLRRMLFGTKSEKTRNVVGDKGGDAGNATSAAGADAPVTDGAEKPKAPGHGRNGAAAYPGAKKIKVPHAALQRGDGCPDCTKGKVYPLPDPAVILRVQGMAPLAATLYELDRLRCNLCGEVFTAPSPAGVGEQKYDETAASMIGLLKYGAGLPFNRIEKLQRGLGIPLPATTQWDIVEQAAGLIAPAHAELINQAAQAEVLHNDDTTAKILELGSASREDELTGTAIADERTGVFTTGIVAKCQDHRIALFFTGRKHAGENLADVLSRRSGELAAPIQMCDALSRNLPGEFKTILANCLSHSRRRFVDVVNDFPAECRHLLETLGKVYKNDALARQRALSPEERLRFHQEESGPLMNDLAQWLRQQFEERKVEPNSGLGDAISYMQKYWMRLTLFLRVPGAPLDNNICERALKKAILHRKNALFFKTENGAHVGDVFMSLIHTVELNGENPFEYLVALQRYHDEVAVNPGDWMPWTYRDTLARLANEPAAPD